MSSSLTRATVRGVLWNFATTAAGKLVTLAGLAVLARLLAPEAFGLVASALVFIAYVETLGDLGTGMALIYWPSRREDAAQVTFFFNLITGVAWTALAWALAPAVGHFFHQPEAGSLLRALAWSFVIKSLGNTHDALLRKDLRFRARLIPESSTAAVKAGVAIILAFQGFGAWSLAWGQLAGLAARTILLWLVCSWRPSFGVPRDLVKPMLVYGRGLVAVNVLASIAHHVDLVIVGRMLGPTSLGAYQMAYKVPELVIATVIWVTGKVLFPAFSRVNLYPDKLSSAYLNALRYVSLAAIPMAIVLFTLAEPIVLTFLGAQWRESIPILQALAVYACLRALGSNAGDVLKASGQTHLLALLGVVKTAVLIPVLILGARAGAVGVAVAMAGVAAASTLLNLAVVLRILELKPSSLLKAVAPGLPAAAALAIALTVWTTLPMMLGEQLRLVGALALGTIVYLTALQLTSPETVRHARDSLRK